VILSKINCYFTKFCTCYREFYKIFSIPWERKRRRKSIIKSTTYHRIFICLWNSILSPLFVSLRLLYLFLMYNNIVKEYLKQSAFRNSVSNFYIKLLCKSYTWIVRMNEIMRTHRPDFVMIISVVSAWNCSQSVRFCNSTLTPGGNDNRVHVGEYDFSSVNW